MRRRLLAILVIALTLPTATAVSPAAASSQGCVPAAVTTHLASSIQPVTVGDVSGTVELYELYSSDGCSVVSLGDVYGYRLGGSALTSWGCSLQSVSLASDRVVGVICGSSGAGIDITPSGTFTTAGGAIPPALPDGKLVHSNVDGTQLVASLSGSTPAAAPMSASGCHDGWVVGESIYTTFLWFKHLDYRINLKFGWCWMYGLVSSSSVNKSVYLTDTDGTYFMKWKKWDTHAYAWKNNYVGTGYYVGVNAQTASCAWDGSYCIDFLYPWIWVRLHSDGTYSWDAGL